MQKDFYFNFKKVGFSRNKMLFISSKCPKTKVDKIRKKYGNDFYIFLINA